MYWFVRSSSKDRRSAERCITPQLAAYYWNGDHAAPHRVRDMSPTGTYIVTEDRWHAGTLLMLTLQKPVTADDTRSSQSIRVQSKVIRSGTDGVGFAFIFAGKESVLSEGADRKTFIAFSQWVQGIKADLNQSERIGW